MKHHLIKDHGPMEMSDYLRESIIKNPYLSPEVLHFYRDNFKTLVKIYQYVNIDWLIKCLSYRMLGKLLEPFKTKNELQKWRYKPRVKEPRPLSSGHIEYKGDLDHDSQTVA